MGRTLLDSAPHARVRLGAWRRLGACGLALALCGACNRAGGYLQESTTPIGTSQAPLDANTTDPNAPASAEPNTTTPPTSGSSASFVLGPYKDVTVDANWTTGAMGTSVTGTSAPVLLAVPNLPALSWGFATGECGSETWGGIDANLMVSNVASFAQAKVPYILSTGGAGGTFTCGSDANFVAFLQRYDSNQLIGVDFDIENGQTQAQIQALVDRVKSAQQLDAYKKLRFSFTLATLGSPDGESLASIGNMVMAAIAQDQVTNYYINLMVMDYGSASQSTCVVENGNCAMGLSAVQAAQNFSAGYKVPYSQIELTPMIGGNDSAGEVFTLSDANTVMNFARNQNLAGVHWWALDRDTDCTSTQASNTCNNYGQAGTLGFLKAFLAAN